MADTQDLERLRSGELDLSNCDFIDADISGEQLPGRNFKGALLTGLKAEGANLANGVLPTDIPHLDEANFIRADLRGASFRQAHIRKVNFTGADLRGANFERSFIDEFTKFDDAVVDETTNFIAASMMRKTSRYPAFRFYELADGKLKRKPEQAAPSDPRGNEEYDSHQANTPLPMRAAATDPARSVPAVESSSVRTLHSLERENAQTFFSPTVRQTNPDFERRLATTERDLTTAVAELSKVKVELATLKSDRDRLGLGGNNPPDDIDIEQSVRDIEVGVAATRILQVQAGDAVPSFALDVLTVCYEALKRAFRAVSAFAMLLAIKTGEKFDKVTDKFAETAGASLGSKTVILGALASLQGDLPKVIAAIAKWLGL